MRYWHVLSLLLDSNQRHLPCKGSALPTELRWEIVTPSRLELETPSLKVRCSNQLSYEVIFCSVSRTRTDTMSSSQMRRPTNWPTTLFIFVRRAGLEPAWLDFQSSALTIFATSGFASHMSKN